MSEQLTPEQLALIEANRRKALDKRKLTPSTSGQCDNSDKQQQQQQPKQKERIRATRMSTGYYEYNLSTMKDTRGGFLEEEQPANSPEKKRKIIVLDEIPYNPDPQESPKCHECGSLDLDIAYLKIFRVKVCKQCIEAIPDKYSLLTKTEAKEDYLLTDSELRDRERLPVWEKPNPHKSTWNNMLLYLRENLEEFAVDKWGSLEELDKEFERRAAEKRDRKEKKYRRSVADLRRRTRVEEFEKKRRERLRLEKEHTHSYEPISDDDSGRQRCSCGLVIEVEEF